MMFHDIFRKKSIQIRMVLTLLSIFSLVSAVLPVSAQENDACFGTGCHSDPGSGYVINQTRYETSSHNLLECTDCHSASLQPADPDHGSFLRTLYGTTLTQSLNFTRYNSSNYQLCYFCHNETQLIGLPSGYSNNLWSHRSSSGYPLGIDTISTNFVNELFEGYNFGNYPANIHWDHLDMHGINNNKMWDSNRDGSLDSMTSCTACHDPHGNSFGPVLTRNDLGLEFKTDANGEYGIINSSAYLGPGGDVYCYGCHGHASYFTYYRTPKDLMTECIFCHSGGNLIISSQDLGLHSLLNGTSDVDQGDCRICHFDNPHTGPDATNTYYCTDCHTNAGTGPVKSNILFEENNHGRASCVDCHIADGTYHQDNPRGSVANTLYVNRYVPGDANVTDCVDCHYGSNLDDAPFHAPGAGSHITTFDIGDCKGCHAGQVTIIGTIHRLSGANNKFQNPTITTPVLSSYAVTKGTEVTIMATASVGGLYDLVDGAQYRIENATGEVVPWTFMYADDGNFDGTSEQVNITMNTSTMLGDYTIQVRGMGGGIAQSSLIRYYPMNGDVSGAQSTALTVELPKGYINGTVTSSGSPVSGVSVFTTGATTTTDTNGNYSLKLPEGIYDITARKQPVFVDTTVTGIEVIVETTTTQDIVLTPKPFGIIQGTVKN